MKIPGRQDGQSPYLAQPYRILNWETELKNLFTYLLCRKLLFNALVKPILEYCCSVRGNAPNDQLLRLLRVQKRCSILILDARLLDNSAQMFQKLQWLLIDDIIRIKKTVYDVQN